MHTPPPNNNPAPRDLSFSSTQEKLLLGLLILLGVVFRLLFIDYFRTQPFPPDLPWGIMQSMQSPYDTIPREPLFVWWLWGLFKAGASGFLTVRTWTFLWYIPTALVLWVGSRRLLGRWAWVVLVLYSALPAQIASDANGERHLLETFFTVLLWNALFIQGLPDKVKSGGRGAVALAGMFLTRINLGVSAVLAWGACVRRRNQGIVFALGLLPSILLLLPHFMANKRKTGDYFYSLSIHSYWFANKEFIGQPGFPATFEEWQTDPYRPSLTYRQWAFEAHSFRDYVTETVLGYKRILGGHFASFHLSVKLPPWIRLWLVLCMAVGLCGGFWFSAFRGSILFLATLIFPFAFVSHVHMAARFYSNMAPLIYVFIALGHLILIQAGIRSRLGPWIKKFQPISRFFSKT